MNSDLSGWLWAIINMGGFVVLGLFIAWGLLLRRVNGRAAPSTAALKPDAEARWSGRSNHWQDWAVLALGLWLFASPFLLGFWREHSFAGADAWLFGTLLMSIAAAAVYQVARAYEWADLAIGAWIAASPFVLGFAHRETETWNFVVTGLLVLGLAASELFLLRGAREPGHGLYR